MDAQAEKARSSSTTKSKFEVMSALVACSISLAWTSSEMFEQTGWSKISLSGRLMLSVRSKEEMSCRQPVSIAEGRGRCVAREEGRSSHAGETTSLQGGRADEEGGAADGFAGWQRLGFIGEMRFKEKRGLKANNRRKEI